MKKIKGIDNSVEAGRLHMPRFPTRLHIAAKSAAAVKQMTLTAWIVEAVKDKLRKEGWGSWVD